jgi:hypothetical protein
MPESFGASGSGRDLRARADRQARLRLDALIAPGAFARHGTGVATRMLVYDKVAADCSEAMFVQVDGAEALLPSVEALPRRRSGETIRPGQKVLPGNETSMFRRSSTLRPAPRPMRTGFGLQPSVPLAYRILEETAPITEQVGIYLPYRPSRVMVPGAAAHPTPLVESIAMGSIAAPKPDHAPLLPPRLLETGLLSEAQLETLIYSGSSFERDLPGGFTPTKEGCELEPSEGGAIYRCGFFLGDGTGAGKGRQVAGVILDQWLRGNRRHIWISKNETLLEDARRDWSALGGLPLDIQPLSRWKLGAPIEMDAGILFVTYPTLRSGRGDATRLQQIIDWATSVFEGVVAFDEAHAMANAAGGEGSRGKVKGSEQGICGLRLQNLLPRARVLYASATGASDVNNLAYAARLGLWGPETAFANRSRFVTAIREGGIAAMELVARDLKALGLYTARALSFSGVEYDVLEHELTLEQIEIYDAYADAWAIIHANLESALEVTRVMDAATGATLNAGAKAAALSRFEGTKQRFFGQLLLSMKLPSLLPAIEADLKAGHAVVVQLVSTAEAMLDRRLAELGPAEREALEIDLSPREHVIDYLSAAFPTRQMRVFTDSEGNARSEPLADEEGRPGSLPSGDGRARHADRAALRASADRHGSRCLDRAVRHRRRRGGDGTHPPARHRRRRPPEAREPHFAHQSSRDRRLHARRQEDPRLLRRGRHRPKLSCLPQRAEPGAEDPLSSRAGLAGGRRHSGPGKNPPHPPGFGASVPACHNERARGATLHLHDRAPLGLSRRPDQGAASDRRPEPVRPRRQSGKQLRARRAPELVPSSLCGETCLRDVRAVSAADWAEA